MAISQNIENLNSFKLLIYSKGIVYIFTFYSRSIVCYYLLIDYVVQFRILNPRYFLFIL